MHEGVSHGTLNAKARAVVAELAAGLGKVPSRFVADMVCGLLAGGSVRISRIAEALAEPIALHATHKRLSRNLANHAACETVAANLLAAAAELVTKDALLVVDAFDLAKPHARSMEYLGEPAANEATGSAAASSGQRGYRVCEIFGWDAQGEPMPAFAELAQSLAAAGERPEPGVSAWNRLVVAPLAQTLWSHRAPDYQGEAAEVLALVRRVAEACGGRGVFALDGTRDAELLEGIVAQPPERFLVRPPESLELLHGGRQKTAGAIGRTCKTPYGVTVFKRRDGFDEGVFIHFGHAAVRLPAQPERPLWLIVIKGLTGGSDGWDPLLIVTNQPMRRSRNVLWRPVWSFLHYWDAVITNQRIKQQFDFEDVRVLSYNRLRNITTLVQAASFVAAQWPGVQLEQFMSLRPRPDVPVRLRGSRGEGGKAASRGAGS